MFGINYIKFDSTAYVIHYTNGKIKKEGRGLAFYYFEPMSSIAAIPLGSNDVPFIFSETTLDYQTVTIQGQITYKISDPKKLAELLDFTVNAKGFYKKDDSEKLFQRIINEAQSAVTAYIHSLGIKDAIRATKLANDKIFETLSSSPLISMLGIEVLKVNVLAIRAAPEMERALETETRERLQKDADLAIYDRRNFAVEQERIIKETELNTEIAVEEKKKQIAEKKMESDVVMANNQRKLREMKMEADIAVENQKKLLIDVSTANQKKEADAKSYTLTSTLKPYKDVDWKTLMAISGNDNAKLNIALAFRELAENAGKIGTLNISPDLLEQLLEDKKSAK